MFVKFLTCRRLHFAQNCIFMNFYYICTNLKLHLHKVKLHNILHKVKLLKLHLAQTEYILYTINW